MKNLLSCQSSLNKFKIGSVESKKWNSDIEKNLKTKGVVWYQKKIKNKGGGESWTLCGCQSTIRQSMDHTWELHLAISLCIKGKFNGHLDKIEISITTLTWHTDKFKIPNHANNYFNDVQSDIRIKCDNKINKCSLFSIKVNFSVNRKTYKH